MTHTIFISQIDSLIAKFRYETQYLDSYSFSLRKFQKEFETVQISFSLLEILSNTIEINFPLMLTDLKTYEK